MIIRPPQIKTGLRKPNLFELQTVKLIRPYVPDLPLTIFDLESYEPVLLTSSGSESCGMVTVVAAQIGTIRIRPERKLWHRN